MLDKYYKIQLSGGLAGQDGKTGFWYCKELQFNDHEDLGVKIGQVNKVLNRYNAEIEKQKKKSEKKEDKKKKKE